MQPSYRDIERPCSPNTWRQGRFVRGATTLALVGLLSACLLPPLPPSPEVARAHQARSEALFDESQIPAALEAMRAANQADPTDPLIALRLGELYEFVDQPATGLALYRKALTRNNLPAEVRDELTYRSALICALKLSQTEAAQALLAALPHGARSGDLQAVLLLTGGDPRGALQKLNEVRQQPLDQVLGARVALHAAQAYIALGAFDEAFAVLYQAINLSGRSSTSHDVQTVWDDLKTRVGPR